MSFFFIMKTQEWRFMCNAGENDKASIYNMEEWEKLKSEETWADAGNLSQTVLQTILNSLGFFGGGWVGLVLSMLYKQIWPKTDCRISFWSKKTLLGWNWIGQEHVCLSHLHINKCKLFSFVCILVFVLIWIFINHIFFKEKVATILVKWQNRKKIALRNRTHSRKKECLTNGFAISMYIYFSHMMFCHWYCSVRWYYE